VPDDSDAERVRRAFDPEGEQRGASGRLRLKRSRRTMKNERKEGGPPPMRDGPPMAVPYA
jgi:hypothetical protein